MSAFQKLFLATAILATGFAVAILLGQPVAGLKAPSSPRSQPPQVVALTPPVANAAATNAIPSARLLPDADAQSKTTNPLDAPALLAPLATTSSFASEPIDPPITQFATVGKSSPSPPRAFESNGPVVHLRNEAPRALGNEQRSPITVRRLPPIDSQPIVATTSSASLQVQSVWSAPPTTLGSITPPAGATPAMPAGYANAPYDDDSRQSQQPQPQTVADEADDTHTHVVADGDSLEKLAALYLSDPQRGKEIYELNRDVLSDPNLLPIGAELKIPDRVTRASFDRQSRRPGFQGDPMIRQATNGDMVPIRSLPDANSGVIPPHAQLTHPIAAD